MSITEYAHNMMVSLLEGYNAGPSVLRESTREMKQEDPGTLASRLDHPIKADAVAAHRTRYNLE